MLTNGMQQMPNQSVNSKAKETPSIGRVITTAGTGVNASIDGIVLSLSNFQPPIGHLVVYEPPENI